MILTYKLKHSKDFSNELVKARQIAEFAIKTRSKTSADVKHFGLKSAIANQILRKYGRDKKTKKIRRCVNLIIPNQGIFVDKALKLITIPCLKLKLCYYHLSGFEKVNQIEIDKEYAYVSVTIPESPQKNNNNNNDNDSQQSVIGIDLNTIGHVAVVSNPDTGKVWKLGKEANHIALKYREIRRRLQKAGKYKKVKRIKDRKSRIIRNLNHHISKKIVEIAKQSNTGIIRLEKLTHIRQRAKTAKAFRYSLNSWSFYQLQKFVEYKAKLQGIAVSYVDSRYTSKICSRCGHIGDRDNKKFKCTSCGHVDHADSNASFNIGKPVSYCVLSIGQLHTDSDVCKGSTDTPKGATPIMMETLEPLAL